MSALRWPVCSLAILLWVGACDAPGDEAIDVGTGSEDTLLHVYPVAEADTEKVCLTPSEWNGYGCDFEDVCFEFPREINIRGELVCDKPEHCAAGWWQTIIHNSERGFVWLRFSEEIVGNYSTESFNKYLESAAVGPNFTAGDLTGRTRDQLNAGELKFEYEDGWLRFTHVSTRVVAGYDPMVDEACGEGGCGEDCIYEGDGSYTMHVELRVPEIEHAQP